MHTRNKNCSRAFFFFEFFFSKKMWKNFRLKNEFFSSIFCLLRIKRLHDRCCAPESSWLFNFSLFGFRFLMHFDDEKKIFFFKFFIFIVYYVISCVFLLLLNGERVFSLNFLFSSFFVFGCKEIRCMRGLTRGSIDRCVQANCNRILSSVSKSGSNWGENWFCSGFWGMESWVLDLRCFLRGPMPSVQPKVTSTGQF